MYVHVSDRGQSIQSTSKKPTKADFLSVACGYKKILAIDFNKKSVKQVGSDGTLGNIFNVDKQESI